MTQPDRARQEATLKRLDRFSYWTDSNIRIPFTRFRLGLSPIIGLVPVVGDFVGLVLSLYVLVEARKVEASKRIQLKMISNMLIEFFGGLLPVIGDAFDAIYKANTRNTELLRAELLEQLGTIERKPFPWLTLVGLSILFGIVLLLFVAFL